MEIIIRIIEAASGVLFGGAILVVVVVAAVLGLLDSEEKRERNR